MSSGVTCVQMILQKKMVDCNISIHKFFVQMSCRCKWPPISSSPLFRNFPCEGDPAILHFCGNQEPWNTNFEWHLWKPIKSKEKSYSLYLLALFRNFPCEGDPAILHFCGNQEPWTTIFEWHIWKPIKGKEKSYSLHLLALFWYYPCEGDPAILHFCGSQDPWTKIYHQHLEK